MRFRFDFENIQRDIEEEEDGKMLLVKPRVKTRCGSYHNYEIVNYVAACLHLVQALWGVMLNELDVSVQETYVDWREGDSCSGNATAVVNGFVLTRESQTTHSISLKWLIIAFHLLSFTFELGVTDPFCCWSRELREEYTKTVNIGVNSLRFIEYSASASIMLIAIALVSGIYESYALIGIGFLTFATMALGGVAEQLFSDKLPTLENDTLNEMTPKQFPFTYRARVLGWVCHFTGWITMLSAYGIILRNFYYTNSISQEQAPWFVWLIVIAIFILYNIFGGIQFYQLWQKTSPVILWECKDDVKLGKVNNQVLNRQVEMVYVVNSLVSKTLLGMVIIFQVINRENTSC